MALAEHPVGIGQGALGRKTLGTTPGEWVLVPSTHWVPVALKELLDIIISSFGTTVWLDFKLW